ncbi:MAG: hypothetical protein QM820_15770 [Minicystis sp.]
MVTTCSGDDHGADARARPLEQRFHAGASYGVFGSSLSFADGPSRVDIQRRAVTASLEYRITDDMTAGGGAGAGLGGLFTVGDARYKVLPGWMVTATWSRRLLDGAGRAPFLLIGLAFGASGASTRQETTGTAAPKTASLYALDIRAALTVGKTFWRTLSPYASVRAFGGPVFWGYNDKSIVGGDRYHFQIALGMVAALPRGFDVFADGSPVGERAMTIGMGKSF